MHTRLLNRSSIHTNVYVLDLPVFQLNIFIRLMVLGQSLNVHNNH